MPLDEAADDGQPKAEAAAGSIAALTLLDEKVEDVRERLGGDSDARVPDDQHRVVALRCVPRP